MKLGLVSDVHSAPAPLAEAIRIFHDNAVDRIVCAGDIAGYNQDLGSTIDLLLEHDVACIIGNHDQSWLEQNEALAGSRDYEFLRTLPSHIEYEIEGNRLYIVHAQPPDGQHGGIKLLDMESQLITEQMNHWQQRLSGLDADILIVGHTHQVYAEQTGDVLVINPGSSAYNNSCMILHLPSRKIDTFALQGQPVRRVWNWGMQVRPESQS